MQQLFFILLFILILKEYILAEPPHVNKYKKPISKEVLFELETPNLSFSDHTINYFISLVNEITIFDMKNVLYYYFPELYTKCDKDDVQILYGGDIGVNATGHFLCIFYKVENQTVLVYDSLYRSELHERQLQIINNRYPMRKYISFIEPKIKQIDNSSCGAFAIAYATTLILGEDASVYEYEMDFDGSDYSSKLRKHIRKMFESYSLEHFPRIVPYKDEL